MSFIREAAIDKLIWHSFFFTNP